MLYFLFNNVYYFYSLILQTTWLRQSSTVSNIGFGFWVFFLFLFISSPTSLLFFSFSSSIFHQQFHMNDDLIYIILNIYVLLIAKEYTIGDDQFNSSIQ